MTPEQLVNMIALPAGLFCLFLMFLSVFLPWLSVGLVSISGVHMHDAGIFLVLTLLVGAAGGLTYLLKDMLPQVAAGAAGFGAFGFFFMLGAVLSGRTGAGVWVGLLGAMGTAGAFITLSLYRPVAAPAVETLKLSPLMKRHGALFLALAIAGAAGIVYLLLAVLTPARVAA
jgi:hypothetical protein